MRKYLLVLTCSCFAAHPAMAQETDDGAIVVVATGLSDSAERTGNAVSVIGAEELEEIQGPDITRALRRLPGVSVSRNGGVGGFTGVSVRGAPAEHLLVLVDGVRVNDVSSPAGGFDFGNLTLGAIESVELLRGSNSVIWGSDAIGGVLNLTTRRADGVEASAEYGGDEQASANLGYGLRTGALSATLSGGYLTREGFSAAALGTENDGFRQWNLTGSGNLALRRDLSLVANGRYAEGELEIDGYPPPFFIFNDTLERQDTREWSARIGADYRSRALELRAGLARSNLSRDLVNEAAGPEPYYRTDGRSTRAELFGRAAIAGSVALDFGGDYEWTTFTANSSFAASSGEAEIRSVHALLGRYGDRFTLAGGARYDDHSRFGGEWSLGANGAYEFANGWRLRASYGEGFKAPSLFQLLSDFGNAALQPERSKSYDAGIAYGTRNEDFHAAFSFFRRDSRDLIGFVSCFGAAGAICEDRPNGTYANIGRARAQGFELEAGAALSPQFRARAAYSFIETEDRTRGSAGFGNQLARRPRHALSASVDWQSPFGLALGADLRLVSDRFDDPANSVPLDGYALADLRAVFPFGERLELYGRIENLTNADYVEVAGYNTQGRAAYIGARFRM